MIDFCDKSAKARYDEQRMLWTHLLHGIRELLAVAVCDAINSGDEGLVHLQREQVCAAVDDITDVLKFMESDT